MFKIECLSIFLHETHTRTYPLRVDASRQDARYLLLLQELVGVGPRVLGRD